MIFLLRRCALTDPLLSFSFHLSIIGSCSWQSITPGYIDCRSKVRPSLWILTAGVWSYPCMTRTANTIGRCLTKYYQGFFHSWHFFALCMLTTCTQGYSNVTRLYLPIGFNHTGNSVPGKDFAPNFVFRKQFSFTCFHRDASMVY